MTDKAGSGVSQSHPAIRPNCFQEISNQLLSLPVTVSDFLHRPEAVPLAQSSLWLRRDKLFSKWRERFFTLTSSHLKCFQTEEASVLLWKVTIRPSQGTVISVPFQMSVSDILDVVMSDKKGYLTLSITFRKEGKIMLRSSSGIQAWFGLLRELSGRVSQQQSTAEFWSGKFPLSSPLSSDRNNVDHWLLQRQFLGQSSRYKCSRSRYLTRLTRIYLYFPEMSPR